MSGRRVGRYLMQDRIASGGMASVHIGRILGPAGFTRLVAIKQLHEHLSGDPEFATMFLDEARLTAIVQHPNVVSTIDVVSDQGDLFLVMDYVVGESLANLLTEAARLGQPVPLPVVSSIMGGVLNGLHAAHEARSDRGEPMRIVHRDVSPHNILVGADGIARVADFGIAKAATRLHSTRDGKIKGKLAYMAPEQLQREDVDRRADVYGAGVVLWEMTTAKPLFSGEDAVAVIEAVRRGAPSPPSAHRADVPPALDAVVSRALAVDPAARYPTAVDFVAHLEVAVPPASPREVAAWVAAIAGPGLADRRKLTVDMPTASQAIDLPMAAVAQRATPAPTPEPARPLPAPVAKHPRRAGRIWIGGGALLVIGGIALASAVGISRLRAATAAPLPSAAPSVDPQPPQDPSVESAVPPPPSSPEAPTEASAETPVVAPTEPPPAPHPRPGRGGHAAPQSRSGCNPPFIIDGNGVKRFKPACF